MLRFPFALTPLDRVEPWGGERHLHWFALTDGRYRMEVDGHELLDVDYYLARLWEDLLDWTSDVLEPVPEALAEFVSSDPLHWTDPDTDEADEARIWHDSHRLDLGYLRQPPTIGLDLLEETRKGFVIQFKGFPTLEFIQTLLDLNAQHCRMLSPFLQEPQSFIDDFLLRPIATAGNFGIDELSKFWG